MVRDARLDGQPVPLDRRPAGARRSCRAPDASVLSLEISLPLRRGVGRRVDRAAVVAGGAVARHADAAARRRGSHRRPADSSASDPSRPPKASGRRSAAPISRWRFRGSARPTIGAPNSRCAYRARVASVDRTRRRGLDRSPRPSASKCKQGLARDVSLAIPPGLVDQPGQRRDRCRLGDQGRAVARAAARSGLDRALVRRAGREPACRPMATSPCRWCACPPRSVKPAASRSACSAPARSRSTRSRGLEPGDVSDLADVVAGRESPSMVAFRLRPASGADPRSLQRLRQALHAASGADRQHRRGAVSRARRRRRPVPGRGALRGSQQPAQLPESHAAAARDDLERVGRRQSGAAGRRRGTVGAAALEKGRAGEDAPTFVVRITYLQPVDSWLDQSARAPRSAGARSADLADRRRAVSLAALPRRAAAGHVPRRIRSRCLRRGAARQALRASA